MTSTEKQAFAEKYFEGFYHKTTPEKATLLVEELLANDFKDHASLPNLPANKEGFKQGVSTVLTGFHQEYKVNHLFSDGNFHTGVWTAKITHHGNFLGIPATNKTFEIEGITIYEVVDGKIKQHWEKFDLLKIMDEIAPKMC